MLGAIDRPHSRIGLVPDADVLKLGIVPITREQHFPHMPPVHADLVDRAVLRVVAKQPENLWRKVVNSSWLISPETIANSRCLTTPSPDTLPPMRTLYGGSVKMKSARSRSMRLRYAAGFVASPQMRTCFPRRQVSPRRLMGGPSPRSGIRFSGCSLSSSKFSMMQSTSAASKPVKSTSNPTSASSLSSIASSALSQPAFSARRLSART